MKGKKFPFKLPSTEWGPPQSGNGLLHSWALRLPKRRLCQINSGVCPTKPELSPNYHSSFRSFHWSTIRSIDRKHTRTLKKVELHSKSKSSTIKSEQDETTHKNKRGKGEKKKISCLHSELVMEKIFKSLPHMSPNIPITTAACQF